MIYLAFSYQHCWRFYFNKYRAISVWIKLNLSTVLLSTEFLSKDDCFNVQLQSIRNLWSIAKSYLIPLIWKTNKGVLSIRSTCTGLRPEINSLTFFFFEGTQWIIIATSRTFGYHCSCFHFCSHRNFLFFFVFFFHSWSQIGTGFEGLQEGEEGEERRLMADKRLINGWLHGCRRWSGAASLRRSRSTVVHLCSGGGAARVSVLLRTITKTRQWQAQ